MTQPQPLIRSLLRRWWIAPSKQNESTTTAESLTAYRGGLIAIMSSQLATMASQISESEKRKASRDVISAPPALDCHRKEACHLRQAPSPGRTYPLLQSTRFTPVLCVPLATRTFYRAGRPLPDSWNIAGAFCPGPLKKVALSTRANPGASLTQQARSRCCACRKSISDIVMM